MITIYGIKNCDSVKKALKFFKAHGLESTLVDFKQTPVDATKIASWLEKTDIKTLFNARSTTYRTLKLKEKNLTEQEQQEYLAKENLLIKRPVIEYNKTLIVGFKEESYKDIFL
jgi:Spx/MgsR family transcriptional regulator